MTKLPPGFTHELNQHVPRSHPATKDQGGVPVFDLNDFCCGAHGFAALLETEPAVAPEDKKEGVDTTPTKKEYTLFDTGPDTLSLVRNIKALQVPITKITRVVTSHWHSDHTGGLLSFLELRNKCIKEGITTPPPTGTEKPCNEKIDDQAPPAQCVVDVHPSRPHLRAIAPPPTWKSVLCALPKDPSFEEITAAGGVLERRKDGHTVASGTIWISGEIPRVTEFEQGLLGGVRWVEKGEQGWTEEREIGPIGENATGRWIAEPHLMDERYAAVDVEGKGLVLFSS
jgi:7,8-dihydropterin-6-yl-methyl-4-(beta-D-ribofuranosyl)aminobenzene 5'-phosphate synthase